jgi:hypothetical protein
VASVASHSISNQSIWLLEGAARSDDEDRAGRLWRPWHFTRQVLCMTAPEFMPRVTAVSADRSGDLGEQRPGHHDNAKGDIRGHIK